MTSAMTAALDAVRGLLAGDGIAWTSLGHRIRLLPERRAERLAVLEAFGRSRGTTTVAVPYLHSTPFEALDFTGPTESAEWFVISARHLLDQRYDGAPADRPYAAWLDLAERRQADETAVQCRIGTLLALQNLTRGLNPPASGRFNAHYFDDLACVRALAAAVLRPGSPAEAAELAETDAAVTHGLDGVWCARGSAAFFSVLLAGGSAADAVAAATAELRDGSWSANIVADLLGLASRADSTLALSAAAEHHVVDQIYSYPVIGPETLGLLLAHVSTASGAADLLLGASSHPRHAGVLLPLAGAAAALLHGTDWLPPTRSTLAGVSVRDLRGTDVLEVTHELVGAASE